MRKLELADAPAPLADMVQTAEQEPVFITKNGQVIAALIHIAEADWEAFALARNPVFQAIVERSRTEHRAGNRLTLEDVIERLGVTEDDLAQAQEEVSRDLGS